MGFFDPFVKAAYFVGNAVGLGDTVHSVVIYI